MEKSSLRYREKDELVNQLARQSQMPPLRIGHDHMSPYGRGAHLGDDKDTRTKTLFWNS